MFIEPTPIERECKNINCSATFTGTWQKLFCSSWCRSNQGRRNYKLAHKEDARRYQRMVRDLEKVRPLIASDACLFCERTTNLHVHHIVKTKLGGDNRLSNLVVLCSTCHANWHRTLDVMITPLLSPDRGQKLGFTVAKLQSDTSRSVGE